MTTHKNPPTAQGQTPTNTGVILIRDKDEHPCYLSAPAPGSGEEIVYSFTASGSPCNDNTARTVQFGGFPSATTIVFYDGQEGNTSDLTQNFWFEVKTTRKRTSTIILHLDIFDSYQPGDIIEPGLRLIRKFRKDNNAQIRDSLSCVCIHAAKAPPTSDETA